MIRSTSQLLRVLTGLCGLFALTTTLSAIANPTVEGSTIHWDEPGWFQVQSAVDYRTLCEGGSSCEVPEGLYTVINLTTGQRWTDIEVGQSGGLPGGSSTTSGPLNLGGNVYLDGANLYWTDSGYYQVQNKSDFSTVCEGGSSCTVSEGTYIVVNHSTGDRLNNVRVSSFAAGSGSSTSSVPVSSPLGDTGYPFDISGGEILFSGTDWYQVQRADNYNTVCEGETECQLAAGTYNIINHSSGARYDGVVLSGETESSAGVSGSTNTDNTNESGDSPVTADQSDGASPVVVGNRIEFPGAGWYQVQTADGSQNVCEGSLNFCDVDSGLYKVINHSSGERFDDVRVGPAPPSAIYSINRSDAFNRSLENATSPVPDDGRPSQPQNLRVELIANDWVEINWAPSVDNGEVVSYNIYRDDTSAPLYVISRDMAHPNGGIAAELAKYWQTTSFIDCNRTRFSDVVFFCDGGGGVNGDAARGPLAGAAHTYYVSAVDDNGNESDLSEPLDVQLYPFSGGELQTYLDPDLMGPDAFPFNRNLSQPASFVGDLQLVFNEDFNGSELDSSRWNTRLSWGPDVVINGEKQYFVDTLNASSIDYDPFSFTGSTMKIVATKTPAADLDAVNGQRYLSGALSSHDKFGFTYGYVESRMKVSGVFGALSTLYLYHRYPGDHAPEIDIAEYLGYNQFGDEDMFQTYHYRDVNYADNGWTRSSPTMSERNDSGALYADAFHTYGLLWEPGLVIWYIDGVEVKRLHGPQVGRRQMNLVTYLVTGSNWTKAPDEYRASDELVEMQTDSVVNLPFKLETDHPVEMEIDYIRVWQLPGRQG